MEYRPSWESKYNHAKESIPVNQSRMSLLAMTAPAPHAGFEREHPWDKRSAYSRPRTEPERFSLPSIRQAFPELRLRLQPEAPVKPPTVSPTIEHGGVTKPSEYIHSPNRNKRRCFSRDEDQDVERLSRIPRLHTSPGMPHRLSPIQAPISAAAEGWASSARTSPLLPDGEVAASRSPIAMEVNARPESRPAFPSLHVSNFEPSSAPMSRVRGRSTDDYRPWSPVVFNAPSLAESTHMIAFRPSHYSFPYGHPTRIQSLSVGSLHSSDRTPFAASTSYGKLYHPEYTIMSEGGMNRDNKQRKRRGNLPKETTDTLRAWFIAHVNHPYPTEDEKQELMRQTGLQMNQISNWFINARRRQLPALINSARSEADARGESRIIPSTERPEAGTEKRASVPLSDGESSAFDDDLSALSLRRASCMKRGSV